MEFDSTTYKLKNSSKFGNIALVVGVIGLVLSVVGYFIDKDQFLFSWLTSFVFWVSLGFGGLFFVMLHHMVGAKWSVVVRRIAENVMRVLPYMVIFVIPVFLGMGDLYEWVNIGEPHSDDSHSQILVEPNAAYAAENVEHDTHDDHGVADDEHHGPGHDDHAHQAHVDLVMAKKGYLNVPFFVIRTIVYFAVWTLLAVSLWRLSIKQDRDGFQPDHLKKFKVISAPGIIAFAFTVTFAGFDWMMSLFPAWYSTIYGLYYFAGGLMSVMAFLAVVTVSLRNKGVLDKVISTEHYHDIGKLMFAFIIVWAYFAFSQYLLIWYANIPEETIYYHNRWAGSWKAVSLILPLGHFVIPFILLMSRHVKRNLGALRFFAIFLLVMHWLDLYWNVMPVLHPDSAMPSWMDLTTMMGMGGVFLYLFWRGMSRNALVTFNDPKLEESIKFENI